MKKISIKQAASELGKSQSFIRVGLQRGILPFGAAVKVKTKYNYYINPAKFKQFLGK